MVEQILAIVLQDLMTWELKNVRTVILAVKLALLDLGLLNVILVNQMPSEP